MFDYFSYIIDGVLIILLVTAIILFYRVNAKLTSMKSGQDEFKTSADKMMQSVGVAERSINGMKKTALDLQEKLGSEITRGKVLADELKLITEAGDNLANRIEKSVDARNENAKRQPPSDEFFSNSSSGHPSSTGQKNQDKSDDLRQTHKEQRELLAALKDAR